MNRTVIDPITESPADQRPQPAYGPRSPLTVQDLLTILWEHRRFLGKAGAAGVVVGLALAFLLPVEYTAITTFLPPNPSSSLASAFAAGSGELGLLAGLAGGFVYRSPGELCQIMLRSRTVEDAVIQRFDLMKQYRKKRLSDTRTALERHTKVTLNLKSGLIAISAQDHDAARAAELANGYLDEYKKFTATLAIGEAGQRRLFFEQQLKDARGKLTDSEEALKNTQQSTGMLDPGGSARASVESAVAIRAQIAAKQVELSTAGAYATAENPRVVQLKQEIVALEQQQSELAGAAQDAATDPLMPRNKIPEAGAEYLRRLRDVKYNEAVVAILSRQFEIARLDEAKEGSSVEVVDAAVTPDKRSFPKRTATLLGCVAFALCIASFWVVHFHREPKWPLRRTAAGAVLLAMLAIGVPRLARAQYTDTSGLAAQQSQQYCTDETVAETGVPCTAPGQQLPATMQPRMAIPDSRGGVWLSPGRADSQLGGTGNGLATGANLNLPRPRPVPPPEPQTEFEQMAADTAGRPLEVFGHALFEQPPDTFAPAASLQVPSDYVIGPDDELRIRIWGQINADLRTEVDRSGQIYIPQVGEVPVAGVRYSELEATLTQAVGQLFKSFHLAAAIGRLHRIQVYVVGDARAPGVYTIGSLSTLVNAVFASGGPLPQGSLRHIQLKRGSEVVDEFDLYDLLVRGDKSRDRELESGDVVFIPPVGPLAAIAGSVNTPAIYELKDGETLGALIQTAGGLSSVADGSSATVERLSPDHARTVIQFPLDATGFAFALKGGDVVRVSSVMPRFDDTVTLRGYVANPGRYPFKPGMHVRDLLPDASALLSREYWLNRASTTDARQTAYPVRKKVPDKSAAAEQAADAASTEQTAQPGAPMAPVKKQPMREQTIPEYYRDLARSETITDAGQDPNAQPSDSQNGQIDSLTSDLRKLVPAVNWRYALIQRVNPGTLKTELISFDLGKAVIDNDAANNLPLAPGDVVTIFSQHEITAPEQVQTRYVKLEGEIEHPGVYQLAEGQTLNDVLQAAGGLTSRAYPYGSRLTRESARVEQQKGIDEMVRAAEAEIRASTVNAVAPTTQDAGLVAARQSAQQALLASLRAMQPSGRVVLAMQPDAKTISDYPAIVLEDGDKLVIPARADTVTVSGAVYNPASFVYDPRRSVGDYLQLAGKGAQNANQGHAFVLRADGTVISRQEVGGAFHSGFDRLPMHPGDQIVVPERVDSGLVRALHDWPAILSPLALSALAIAAVAKQ